MKQRAAKKLTKQQKKAITLFSKLRGLGIVGFIDRRGEETEKDKLTANENPIVQNNPR